MTVSSWSLQGGKQHLGQAGLAQGVCLDTSRAGAAHLAAASGRPQDGTVHELAALKEVGTPAQNEQRSVQHLPVWLQSLSGGLLSVSGLRSPGPLLPGVVPISQEEA